MSDDRLRALERLFRETGAVEDEAAWLNERVRAGELARARLVLAARLGHDSAGTLMEGVQPVGVRDLAESLGAFDGEARVRTCLAAAWVVIPLWSPGPREDPRPGIEAAELWLMSGREAAIHEAARFTYVTPDGLGKRSPDGRPPDPAVALSVGVWATTSQALSCAVEVSGMWGDQRDGSRWLRAALGAAESTAASAWGSDGTSKIIAGVRVELVPWLLGYRDPIRDRVEARQNQAK